MELYRRLGIAETRTRPAPGRARGHLDVIALTDAAAAPADPLDVIDRIRGARCRARPSAQERT